jgi:hypothetical protein
MEAFLDVPIRHGARAVGNLYLAKPPGAAPFDDDDQAILELLAAHAAIAIRGSTIAFALQRGLPSPTRPVSSQSSQRSPADLERPSHSRRPARVAAPKARRDYPLQHLRGAGIVFAPASADQWTSARAAVRS